MSLDSSIEIEAGGAVVYSISYQSTRISNTVTGFNMRLDGIGELPKSIVVSNGLLSGTLGDSNGIISSSGKTETRTSKASSVMITDPFGAFLQKAIVFTGTPKGKSIKFDTTKRDEDFLYVVSSTAFQAAILDYKQGKIEEFFKVVTGLSGKEGFTLIFDKENTSPIVKALSKTTGSTIAANSINTYTSSVITKGSIQTVESIIETYLKPLGLEIYYDGNSRYVCRQPKILGAPSKTKWEIKDDDIISMNTVTNPYSAPDIVIPSYVTEEFIVKRNEDLYSTHGIADLLAAQGNSAKSGGSGGYIRIKTYQTDYLFSNLNHLCKLAVIKSVSSQKNKGAPGVGPLPVSDPSFAEVLLNFTTKLASASSYNTVMTGTIVMDFNPEIVHGYEWITYNGEKWYIGTVRHEVARGRSTTVLEIIAKDGDNERVGSVSTSSVISDTVHKEEVKFNEKQDGHLNNLADILVSVPTEKQCVRDDRLKILRGVSQIEDETSEVELEWVKYIPGVNNG